jgi:hypothetical protein
MSNRGSAPNRKTLALLFVQHAASFPIGQLGACKRQDQIQLRAAADHVSNTAQYAIDFSKSAETIEIDHRHRRSLHQKFFVVYHFCQPRLKLRDQSTTYDNPPLLNFPDYGAIPSGDVFQPQIVSILGSVSGTLTCLRPCFYGLGERYHQRLDGIRQFRERQRQARHDDAEGILTAEQNDSNDAFENLHFVNPVEENLLSIMRVDHVHFFSPVENEFTSSAPDAEDLTLTAVKQSQFPAAVGVNQFSSGGVLGIHEPRSNARGERAALTASPGRAVDTAKCPDAARFNSVRRPAKQTAAVVGVQPPSDAAAVNLSSRSMRLTSGGVSSTAAGDTSPPCVAAAFSSEVHPAGVRLAVAAIGSALVATADRVLKNSITLRVVAESASAENSKSVSARS